MKNKILKIAIVGGSIKSTIGKTHIKAISLNKNVFIQCGFFSRKKEINFLSGKSYNINKNKIYSSIKSLILKEKKTLDAVIILTPPEERYKVIKLFADAKISIIAEKPLCSNYKDSLRIYNLLKRKKIFFASTYNYCGYPAIKEIKEQINKKLLGSLKSFNLEMPLQTFVYNKNKITSWRKKDYDIPTLYLDLCSHLINILKFIFNDYPKKVIANSSKNIKYNVVDNVYAWLKYKNYLEGSIWFSKSALGQRNGLKLRVFGSKSSIEWNHAIPENLISYNNKGGIQILDRASPKLQIMNKQKYFTYAPGHSNGFLDAFSNMYLDIFNELIKYKNGKKIDNKYLVDIKESANIISILNSIKISSKNNKWVKTKII
jgi:predicted dehydrogenase